MLQGRERDLRNENASLNIFLNFKRERDYSLVSKERGIISSQIGKASVDEMNCQDMWETVSGCSIASQH